MRDDPPAKQTDSQTAGRRRALGVVLAGLFALTMIMGTGPGVALVNRPVIVLGLPLVYVWGVAWYAVQVAVIAMAYWTVWRDEEEAS
ncbi:MAG: hypothetical protein ACOC46_00260 [Pirellulales bacterium]